MTAWTAGLKPPSSNLPIRGRSSDDNLDFYRYGASELKRLAPILLRRSLTVSTGMAVFLAFFVLGITKLLIHETAIPRPPIPYDVLPSPPPIHKPMAHQVPVAPPAAPPPEGIPVSVPDVEADPDKTIRAQDEFHGDIDVEGGEGVGVVDSIVLEGDGEVLPRPDEPVYVEELPVVITRVSPEYSEIARQASVEGTVIVRALVGKDGRVKDTIVVQSIPVLDDEAVRAVEQWVFKPALTNNRPVAVWVAIPVRFTLR